MAGPPILCITGTTGSGKNAVGIALARRLEGEVVSLDSMKVYRGMDLGTAKPTASERALVRHHMIDVLDPREGMDLRRYIELADEALRDIAARGRTPIVVGGTWMYLAGLLWGVQEGPSRDPEFRAELRAEAERRGAPALHARLAEVDPGSASRIDPNDYRRIERALEIHALTGRPAGERPASWFGEPRHRSLVQVLTWPREELRRRIEARVDRTFDEGWAEELRRLRAAGGLGDEAAMALGYREVGLLLDGLLDEAEARERVKVKTWQFARRQLTWMRKHREARIRTCGPEDTVESLAAEIEADWRAFVARSEEPGDPKDEGRTA